MMYELNFTSPPNEPALLIFQSAIKISVGEFVHTPSSKYKITSVNHVIMMPFNNPFTAKCEYISLTGVEEN